MERRALFQRVKRIVVKIGTSVLADDQLNFNLPFFAQLAQKVSDLQKQEIEVIIATSGAIAAGRVELKMESRPTTLAAKQAAAAVGQIHLMRYYRSAFDQHYMEVAQVLLTHGDFQNRKRFLNARQTLLKLLQLKVIPLINENDTISVEEILVGDNDNLSALVSVLVDADLLILLCDVDGLYTSNPDVDSNAKRIALVDDIESVLPFAQGTNNPASTGGMRTKLEAAQHASAYGIPTLITSRQDLDQLSQILQGEDIGTLILPQEKLRSRKHWMVHTLKPVGKILVDAGAVEALKTSGKSLLPAGVANVEGNFDAGDPVDVAGPDGTPFARGLVSYGAVEIDRLKGQRSSDIESILGFKTQDEIIHRDHLALL